MKYFRLADRHPLILHPPGQCAGSFFARFIATAFYRLENNLNKTYGICYWYRRATPRQTLMFAEQTSRGGAEGGGSDGDILAEAAKADRDGQAFEALRSVKKLAEVKRVFDRFAVDGMLTAYEALQALTEAGCTAPRTHAGRYLRSRRFFGLRREVNTVVEGHGRLSGLCLP